MKNILTVDAQTFLTLPVVDTSVELEISEITSSSFERVKNKLIGLYGNINVVADGEQSELACIDCAKTISVTARRDFDKQRYNMIDALRVTARLTREGDGCPWDRAQTHDSIRVNMIEEAYEAVDAIDKRDVLNMREEFGDVFLQAILQSDIARRANEFDFNDVCDELCKKLIGRHTFIFGKDSAGSPDEALTLWEKAKGIEKNYNTVGSQLSKLPEDFPSLLRAQKTYKKLKKAGYEFDAQSELESALKSKDYAAALYACTALLVDGGADAEVELNKLVKAKISKVK